MTVREKALRVAIGELGVTENPAGSNSGPRVNQYLASAGLGPGYPWCMAFVNWCYRQAGMDLVHPHEASVGFFEAWASSQGFLVTKPVRGDIVCYRFDADNWPDHVGIVEDAGASRLVTIEGNTAFGNDANGGKVMRRTRSYYRTKFARIPGVIQEDDVEMKLWMPLWFDWYLNVRKPGVERPKVLSGVEIPEPPYPAALWAMVDAADRYRASKPDGSADVQVLRAKIDAARAALS